MKYNGETLTIWLKRIENVYRRGIRMIESTYFKDGASDVLQRQGFFKMRTFEVTMITALVGHDKPFSDATFTLIYNLIQENPR